MESMISNSLGEFIESCRAIGEVQDIRGADWNEEIGALTEVTAELLRNPPLILFDEIKDYSPGFRVAALPIASVRRSALALGLPIDRPKMELLRAASKKMAQAQANLCAPEPVKHGPVMQNALTEGAVDIFRFPVPRYHAADGGRYVGTGDCVIMQDPDSGFVNMGTYRIQAHESNLLGLWMSPGQQGRQICNTYWSRGKAAPVVATFGIDPLTFLPAYTKFPWGVSELDVVGGLRGSPLEVVCGPITGLPIPAHAEIAIEGEVPPPSEEARDEGPFGEWPGYYSGGTRGTGEQQPVIRIKAIYYRDNPILMNMAPLWPGAPTHGLRLDAALLWDQLDGMGIQGIAGVDIHYPYLIVVAVKQQYGGHAQQVGAAVHAASATARNGRYTVVVDEDIDPSNLSEVLWAMETRVDPAEDLQVLKNCWSTPLDPRMPPEKRAAHNFTNSRAIFYAVRPFPWKEQFPQVSRTPRQVRHATVQKYQDVFHFPPL